MENINRNRDGNRDGDGVDGNGGKGNGESGIGGSGIGGSGSPLLG